MGKMYDGWIDRHQPSIQSITENRAATKRLFIVELFVQSAGQQVAKSVFKHFEHMAYRLSKM